MLLLVKVLLRSKSNVGINHSIVVAYNGAKEGAKGLSYERMATLGNTSNGATTADWLAS